MQIPKTDFIAIADTLGFKSERTVKNNLNILLAENWVGYNHKTGYYFIRGFENVRGKYGFKSRTSAEFDAEEIDNFKGFLAGAVIGYMVNQQKRERWETERKKSRSNQISRPNSLYYPIASKALSNVLGISISTAYELKQEALKGKYIRLRNNKRVLNVPIRLKRAFKAVYPEIAHKVIIHRGKLVLQETDTIQPRIRFKRRKKIETYKSHISI